MSMSDLPAPLQPSGLGGAAPADPPVALRNALVDAIGRRRRRIRSRMAVAGGMCVAVAAAILAGGVLTGGSPERALAINDGSEWVTVRILDGEAGAAEMTQELQDAGIGGEVRVVPAAPQFVGQWMGVTLGPHPGSCPRPEHTPAAVDVMCLNPMLGGSAVGLDGNVFEIRRDAVYELKTPAIFYVGREPEAGETAVDPSDLNLIQIGQVAKSAGERRADPRRGLPYSP
jgi:hypothetical protein